MRPVSIQAWPCRLSYASLRFERRGDVEIAITRLLPSRLSADAGCSPGCGVARLGGDYLIVYKITNGKIAGTYGAYAFGRATRLSRHERPGARLTVLQRSRVAGFRANRRSGRLPAQASARQSHFGEARAGMAPPTGRLPSTVVVQEQGESGFAQRAQACPRADTVSRRAIGRMVSWSVSPVSRPAAMRSRGPSL